MSEVKVCSTSELVEFVRSHIMEGYAPATFGNQMCGQVVDRLNALEAELESERDRKAPIIGVLDDGTLQEYATIKDYRALESERDQLLQKTQRLEAERDRLRSALHHVLRQLEGRGYLDHADRVIMKQALTKGGGDE